MTDEPDPTQFVVHLDDSSTQHYKSNFDSQPVSTELNQITLHIQHPKTNRYKKDKSTIKHNKFVKVDEILPLMFYSCLEK